MSAHSRIEWTDATWNPVTGCSAVSAGCANCYARRMAHRFHGPRGFDVTLHPERLEIPFHWRKPRRVFVNSMSDLFHDAVPFDFIAKVFDVMQECEHHTFQVLTKRPARMADMVGRLPWPANVWVGATVENADASNRIGELRRVPAAVRFLSCEPLLGPISNLSLDGIHWVIVGGETGPGARQMDTQWAASIMRQCQDARVPFFFKRIGGWGPGRNIRELCGRTWDEYPR